MKLPFTRRRSLEPITFLPVQRVFKPQVEIRLRCDLSGWVGEKRDRKRWALSAGRVYAIDEDKAREFVAKGYAESVHPLRNPLSEDEIAEYDAQVTRIQL